MNKEAEYEEARLTLERLGQVMAKRSASADKRDRAGSDESPDGDGRLGSPNAGGAHIHISAEAEIMATLERTKFHLLADTARQKRELAEITAKVEDARRQMEARREKLSKHNALFLRMGAEAAVKAPQQRLGAATAVLETKKIIERELTKSRKRGDIARMKLNRATERNAQLRATIDSQRKEAMTFRKLFESMMVELANLKVQLADTKAAIDDGYEARDRANEDMRQLNKQFEVDKLERAQEWAVYSEAIEATSEEGGPERLEVASGLLTQQEEDELRRKIKRGQQKMEKDRVLLQQAQVKLETYAAALDRIKEGTGCDDLGDLVDAFQKHEDSKFSKVRATERLVGELEQLQQELDAACMEVQRTEDADARAKAEREEMIRSLEAQAFAVSDSTKDERTGVEASLAEIKAVCPLVEFAFRAIGADRAFDPAGHIIESDELRQKAAEAENERNGIFDGASTPAMTIGEEEEEEDADDEEKADRRFRTVASGDKPSLSLKSPAPFSTPALASGTVGGISAEAMAGQFSPGGGGPGSTTRIRRGSAASETMEMYKHTPGLLHDVNVGITPSTLPRFLGIIETRAADVLHAYAAHVSDVAERASEEASAAQAAAAAAAANGTSPIPSSAPNGLFVLNAQSSIMTFGPGSVDDAASVSSLQGGDGASSSSSSGVLPMHGKACARAAALAAAKAAAAAEAKAHTLAAMAALGPPQPVGRTKESLASSTLMTSILVDAVKMGAGPVPEGSAAAAAAASSSSSFQHEGVITPRANSTASSRHGLGGSGSRRGGGGPYFVEGGAVTLGGEAGGSSGTSRDGVVTPFGSLTGGRGHHTAATTEQDDDAHPLSLSELRAQAAAMVASPPVKAVKSAAKVAATVLSRAGVPLQQAPGGTAGLS